jgi:hypothetical protein
MKLDKIRFAKVVSWISRMTNGLEFGYEDLRELDDILEFEAPTTQHAYCVDIDQLMALMVNGISKIEAIKQYRKITGSSLKDSKDAVEKHWSPIKHIADALVTEETGEALIEVARNAHKAELELAYQHNEPKTLGDILATATKINNENY